MQQDKKAEAISSAMHSLEDGVDMEIAQAAHLMAELANYRVDMEMDGAAGQKALQRMAEAQRHLVEARMKIVGAHASVAEAFEVHNEWPFACPDTIAEVTKLELVKG